MTHVDVREQISIALNYNFLILSFGNTLLVYRQRLVRTGLIVGRLKGRYRDSEVSVELPMGSVDDLIIGFKPPHWLVS